MTFTKLGRTGVTADRQLETFKISDTGQTITLHCAEFTCRCPVTGQPDWAALRITYQPRDAAVESKSLKLYLETFREEGIFHEHLATQIRDDLMAALDPVTVSVTAEFHTRGGIAITAVSAHPALG